MPFPHDTIPDGVILAPHHFYIGVLVAVFGFVLVWRIYPRTGAILSVLGLLIALDDVIEHAFGVVTPGELIGRLIIFPLLRLIE
jgi:hypothetical protein